MRSARFVDALRVLVAHEVEFVVVGMAAGVLHGVPLTTLDVDIVHRRTKDNVERLLNALHELQAPRNLAPTESHLLGAGHQLLTTLYGDVDCLGTIDTDKTHEDILADTEEMLIGPGAAVRVLALTRLIDIKRRAGRAKDLAVLPFLEATLDEVRRMR
jgi:hypothetical protein